MAQIREILFGEQERQTASRIGRIETRVSEQEAALRELLEQRIDKAMAALRQEIETRNGKQQAALDGLELARRIRAGASPPAVVVMTGVEDRWTPEEALERGAQDFLVKGHHDADALVRSIHFARRRRARLAQVEQLAEESQQHHAELQTILDGSPLPTVLIDHERRVRLVNRAARGMLGLEPAPRRTDGDA